MGFLDIFKKKTGYNLPDMYKGIVTKEEYNFVMNTAIQYHEENGFVISKIDEGEIVTEVGGEVQHRYFDNLVRTLSGNKDGNWRNIIYEHFNKLKYNPSAFDYLYKDFSYASQFLRVLIKGESFIIPNGIENYISRVDFPETNTFLILEFEGQFHYVRRDESLEWEQTEEELFEIAINNIPTDEIETKVYDLHENFKIYTFFSGDYSASYMLNLKNESEYLKGKFGTLISIPTKGTALACPIENGNILELIEIINPDNEKFYHEDPGNITLNYYWLHNNKFYLFPSEKVADNKTIKLPKDLLDLLERNS
ncbi:hypothetical protein [Flavobacterium panacagri]|uniref:hypothetical protein n=1 Tax=Flavobacterium panacagri TaxID=3034146 RepID=UPI0025A4D85E|nr:hypothetical protein [Flavobacterium panacagri]